MSEFSTIEWTDATWNPVRGCTKISPGCAHCYAATFAERWRDIPGHPYEQGFDLRLVPEKLLEPLRWRTGRRVFVNSMSDLFQDGVPDEFIANVCATMVAANWHVFQLLTKRSERLRDYMIRRFPEARLHKHIWLGVSVEDRKYGIPRISHLKDTPAAVRFLSIEPLLEDLGRVNFSGIQWVIVGGESGPGARPMEEKWVLSLRDQCLDQGVPFFFKQWGGVRKSQTGRSLRNQYYDEMPDIQPAEAPTTDARNSLLALATAMIGATSWTQTKSTRAANRRG
ncbi:MAG TPA: phage Gp37/Gp68 family protein [Planctomycetota bacterium]|nr:phage Gp37/Gp68 family protein [Planctomycetota bacterium]